MEASRRIDFLASVDIFKNWFKNDIKLLNASSTAVEYPSNSVVITDTREKQESVYFIMSGQCKVVRQIPIKIRRLPFAKERITLAAVDDKDELRKDVKTDSKDERIKDIYLVIQVLKEGSYFGVDEKIGKSSVITITKAELLKIPRTNLTKYERGSFFAYVNSMAMRQYPDRTETFKRYMMERRWSMYKKEVVNGIVSNRSGRLSASMHDVPKCLVRR